MNPVNTQGKSFIAVKSYLYIKALSSDIRSVPYRRTHAHLSSNALRDDQEIFTLDTRIIRFYPAGLRVWSYLTPSSRFVKGIRSG